MALSFGAYQVMDIKSEAAQQQDAKKAPAKSSKAHRIWIGSYLFLSLGFVAAYWLLRFDVFHTFLYRGWLQKVLLAGAAMFFVLLLAKIAERQVTKHSHTKAAGYNLVRLIRLLSVLLIVLAFISFLFANWYAAFVSLGLGSLILGFALQTPISSFIGWVYIILRNPYRVGDRIQVDVFKGDVVEVGYLDTTLWEFGGDYMTNDLPTGRLIRFPNSLVLSGAVYNYSWKRFPYIWNEIPFHIAYESDFDYVAQALRTVAKAQLGPDIEQHVAHLRDMIRETPVDDMDVKEYPFVTFRTNANTWVEATLVYLVPPRQATMVRTEILRKGVKELLKEPGKVLFPNGNSR